jgi:hypothetical protein
MSVPGLGAERDGAWWRRVMTAGDDGAWMTSRREAAMFRQVSVKRK